MKKLLSRISLASFLALIMLLVTTFAIPCASTQAIVGPPIPPLMADPSECWGVFIGIPDLHYWPWDWTNADVDATDFNHALSPTWGTDHVRVLTESQATRSAILSAINWLATNADTNDTVLFFFSGKTFQNEIYPYDYYSFGDEISGTQLNSAFSSVQANKIVFIFSFWENDDLRSDISGSGRIVMFAAGYSEPILWNASDRNNFISYLVEAFDNFDESDTNHDYNLSAEEIFNYAAPLTTIDLSIQHPVIYDGVTGEVPLISKFVFDNDVSLPAGATAVTIDGSNYTSEPQTKYWVPGSTHTVTVPEIVSAGTGTRYVFTGWEGGGTASSISVSKGSYTADYNKEYQLTLTSPLDTPIGDGWYVDGTSASFSITASLETADTKHFFTGWSGDFTGTAAAGSVVMDAPKSITANWRTEFLLTINSAYGTPTGAGWYDEGDSANISVESVQGFIIRQIFDGWTGDLTSTTASTSVTMSGPKVITATWHTDYLQLYILIAIVIVVVVIIIIVVVLVRRKPRGPAAAPPTYSPPPTYAPPPPPAAGPPSAPPPPPGR
jgi:uncharacterized repeat protein (TIGR02543 family)